MKRKESLSLLLILCLLLSCLCACHRQTPDTKNTAVQEAQDAMATIEASFAGGLVKELGTAMIYALEPERAILLTNYHVVVAEPHGVAEEITVQFFADAGCDYHARVLGMDIQHDLAVLETDLPNGCQAITLADTLPLVGDTVFSLAAPGGRGIAAAGGMVSVSPEEVVIKDLPYIELATVREIRFDISLGSGASGGGLFDENGSLLGMINAGGTGDMSGFSFAVPAVWLAPTIQEILAKENGALLPYLSFGASYTQTRDGVSVAEVTPGSAAYVALKAGDLLHTVARNGGTPFPIENAPALSEWLLLAKAGDSITFTLTRGGERTTRTLTLTDAFFMQVQIQEAP